MFQATGVTDFEMRNLTLAGTYDTHPNVYRDMGLGLSDVVDFRIHDVAFQNLARGIEIHGDPTVTRGVIYQNTFTDMYYLEPRGGALGYGVVVYGDGTWPTLALGTSQNVFIEDNTFTRNRHAVASNNGSRYVFRYNTIIDNRENAAAIDAHGRGAWPRGSRQYEIYDNTVDNAVRRYAGILPRGGDGVTFNNSFSSNVTYEVLLTNQRGCAGTYPLPDQIRELYIWNNTLFDGGSAPIFVQSGCESLIQLNRDYFTSQRPGYTPYTYPHPLRAGTPTAPSNLTLTVVSSSLIQLTWTDDSANELGFKIDRWTGAAWVEIATVGVTRVTWNNNREGSGSAVGIGTWAIDGIVLAPGINRITVTARDEAGNVGSSTVRVVFFAETLASRVTPVRAVHFLDLAEAINHLRTSRGLAPKQWTNEAPARGGVIKASHLNDLRAALGGLCDIVTCAPFARAGISQGVPVSAAHLEELREVIGLLP